MPWGDVAFDADLAAKVLGDLLSAPALNAGDVELGKPADDHVVMIAAQNRSTTQASAASVRSISRIESPRRHIAHNRFCCSTLNPTGPAPIPASTPHHQLPEVMH
jgi:hypothetical protein